VTVRVALVGCGTWGKNLGRALATSRRAELIAVADPRPQASFAGARAVPSLDAALDLQPDAVVIATPCATHAELARRALDAGVDVLVEKPLAMKPSEADELCERAQALGRVGMVGHVLRFHPTLRALLAMAKDGELGQVAHLATARLSTAGDGATSALWALGPHDLSLLHALDDGPLDAIGLRSSKDDVVAIEARVEGGLTASIELARRHPTKERRVSVVGTKASVHFDDVRAPERLVIKEAHATRELTVAWHEPLAAEIDHFLGCVEERAQPLTSLAEGAWVVRALYAAERSARCSSSTVISGAEPNRTGGPVVPRPGLT
jgi:predicted dehydrogenase